MLVIIIKMRRWWLPLTGPLMKSQNWDGEGGFVAEMKR